MNSAQQACRNWYEKSYSEKEFGAQRTYPNEELCRFLDREYLSRTQRGARKRIRILELGCGSCPNLWMVAKEGFEAHGIDLSPTSLELGGQMLQFWGVQAELKEASMTYLPYEDDYFDLVFDVFSSYCLCERDFSTCLDEVHRVLKHGGSFFSYSPSINSDAFKNHYPASKIDEWTLDGIKRKSSPFFGNDYAFRFISPEHYRSVLEVRRFCVDYLETVGRTYNLMSEYFEFVTVVGGLVNEQS